MSNNHQSNTKNNRSPLKFPLKIISVEDACNCDLIKEYIKTIPNLLSVPHFSKIEFFSDFVYGTINMPEILNTHGNQLGFICRQDSIIFIDYHGFVAECINETDCLRDNEMPSTGHILYNFIKHILSDDLEKMNSIQENLAILEQNILNNTIPEPLREITDCRNQTMKLYHYYVQLSGLCCDFCNNSQNLLDEEHIRLFNTLAEKVNILLHEAQHIWDYTSQIRDVYQQQLEVHQNSIMKFLTIVTTIFMPLTLITGWYGMNFVHMPELRIKYAYPILLGISITVVIILIAIFKKKKWW